VLKDYQNAPITDAEKVLFWFVEKVNRCSIEIHQRDIEDMHRAGWNDEAVYDAINVCGLFNFYNRDLWWRRAIYAAARYPLPDWAGFPTPPNPAARELRKANLARQVAT